MEREGDGGEVGKGASEDGDCEAGELGRSGDAGGESGSGRRLERNSAAHRIGAASVAKWGFGKMGARAVLESGSRRFCFLEEDDVLGITTSLSA